MKNIAVSVHSVSTSLDISDGSAKKCKQPLLFNL